MKVIISCMSKFWALHLAEQLDKRNHLHKLLTAFYSKKRIVIPEVRKDSEEIDPSKVITNILPVLIGKLLNKFPLVNHMFHYNYSSKLFDEWAKSKLDKCDVLVIWSDVATHTLKTAKKYSLATVLERGSTHILFQKEILEEEYKRYGLQIKPIDARVINDDLANYSIADYISIPSKFAKQTYIERGITSQRLIQVPFGVDLETFRPIPKEDNIFRVVFVGALCLRKGVHYLLEAYSQLKLRNAELMFIGPVSSEIVQFMKKYEGCYKHVGKIPHLELYKYLSQGSVFILPSIEEGLAMVIPQALSCGLPVICTTNTGAEDIVTDGKEGFIIPIRSVEQIKEKILYLYEHSQERAIMGKLAREKAELDLSWEKYGQRMIQEYERILTAL